MSVLDLALDNLQGDVIEKLFLIENVLKDLPQLDIPIRHFFASGVYAREMTAPKDSLIIGKLHKFSQVNIIQKGDVDVLTDTGWQRFVGPCTFESPAGVKRAIYANEETVWTTIFGTDETDTSKVEDALTIGSYQSYLEYKQALLEDK